MPTRLWPVFALLLCAGCSPAGQIEPDPNAMGTIDESDLPPVRPSSLIGTAWRLLAFQGMGDGVEWVPVNAAEIHTIAFDEDGNAEVRLACNRGRARWAATEREAGRGSIELASLSIADRPCPGARLTRMRRDLQMVVSYVIDEDGRLYLNLRADSGNLVWERIG